jgi:hypothetical protein
VGRRRSLLGLFAMAPLVLAGCLWTTNVDWAPTMTFDGLTYERVVAPTANITPEYLRELGETTSVDDPDAVLGSTVYGLEGVPPDRLVVMPSSRPENGDYYLFWHPEPGSTPSTRVSEESNLAEFVNSIPGLCKYFAEVPCSGTSHRHHPSTGVSLPDDFVVTPLQYVD